MIEVSEPADTGQAESASITVELLEPRLVPVIVRLDPDADTEVTTGEEAAR